MEYSIVNLITKLLIIILIYKVFKWFYENILAGTFVKSKIDFLAVGSWAIVTGASDGIGKAYAKALAGKGINLVLISRSESKLRAVAREIESNSDVEIRIIDVDFTNGPDIYKKIESSIQDIDVGILVNNVGLSYPYPEYFLECFNQRPSLFQDMISTNIVSMINLCSIVMPAMVRKGRGIVINVSSMATALPNPLLTVYSATKAFVDKFSFDLNIEYEAHGIIIQCIQPGFVATNMSKIRNPSFFAPSAEEYVKSALRTIGVVSQTTGYLPHTIVKLVFSVINGILSIQITKNIIFKKFLAMRNRALQNKVKPS